MKEIIYEIVKPKRKYAAEKYPVPTLQVMVSLVALCIMDIFVRIVERFISNINNIG